MVSCSGVSSPVLMPRVVSSIRGRQAIYAMCELMTRLGYTLSRKKSVFIPTQILLFLGFLVDTVVGAFRLPPAKAASLAAIRDAILQSKVVDIKTLQRFHGKCISFLLVVPGAKLYTNEVSMAISRASRHSRLITLTPALRQELEHWRFLDSWDGHMPWRQERHLQVVLATDSSLFKWGGVLTLPASQRTLGDFWPSGDSRPIHVKETDALP